MPISAAMNVTPSAIQKNVEQKKDSTIEHMRMAKEKADYLWLRKCRIKFRAPVVKSSYRSAGLG
jgi:hypothetical protein